MRALQVTEERGLAEAELPDPEPGPGEVAIEVAYCGICGSDLHMLPSAAISPGTVMGHEFSGRVVALGEGVSGLEPRQRVCVLPMDPCGECVACRAGNGHLCLQVAARGHGLGGRPGAFAERVTAPEGNVFALPDEISDRHGALVEPLAVAVHAVRLGAAQPADPVVVLGAGPIGVMTALALRASAYQRLVVVEPGERRRDRVASLGFEAVGLDDVHVAVIEALGGELPAAVFECAGHPSGLGLGLELLRPAGTVVAMGVLEEPVPVNQLLLIIKEAQLKGSMAYGPSDFECSIQLIASGAIPADELVTEVAPLARAEELFEQLRRPGTDQLKVLLRPGG